MHGGVYTLVTEKNQPNPYLEDPARDLKVNDTMMLTKINPALMTRQISEIAMFEEGIQFHITSLNPIRPMNEATPVEKQFDADSDEQLIRYADQALYRAKRCGRNLVHQFVAGDEKLA